METAGRPLPPISKEDPANLGRDHQRNFGLDSQADCLTQLDRLRSRIERTAGRKALRLPYVSASGDGARPPLGGLRSMNATPAQAAVWPHQRENIRRLQVSVSGSVPLKRARRVGLTVLAVQLVVLLVWSGFEAGRHAQTGDFTGFYRAWYLISHGTLVPSGWFHAQAILIQWPLAILGLIWPHPITLLVVQDLAIVGAELVAFLWICDIVGEQEGVPTTAYCLTGVALLALDPWIYWSASWDYHSEALGTLFAVLAARALFRGRRIGALWCLLTLLCGLVPAPYVVGIGLSLLLVRGRRTWGAAAVIAGTAWYEIMVKLGVGSGIAHAQGVKNQAADTLSSRLGTALPALTHFWVDVVANFAPAGVLGVFTAPAVGISAVTMGESLSQGNVGYARPSFQNLPIYIVAPIGTIVALLWLRRRFGRRLADGLAVLAVVNVAGWAAVWLPLVVPTWLRVNPSEAASITRIERLIPGRDAVDASQGIAGDFAGRANVALFIGAPVQLPVFAPYTWFVIAPYAGIETAPVDQSIQLIDNLARDPAAKLEYVSNADVWAFRVRAPAGSHGSVPVGGLTGNYPAGLFRSYGARVRRGSVRNWYMEGTDSARGPILWGDYFLKPVGRYRAQVRLRGTGRVSVQLWNDTTNQELAVRVPVLSGARSVGLRGAITKRDPKHSAQAESGFGVFSIDPVDAYPGNVLEIRVYAQSSSTIRVLSVSLQRVTR